MVGGRSRWVGRYGRQVDSPGRTIAAVFGQEDTDDVLERQERWAAAGTAREDPVEGRCVLCKRPADPASRADLATGEYLCDACHGDLREFDRSVHAQLWVNTELGQARRVLLDDWSEAMAALEDKPDADVLPRRVSNADEYQFPE